MLLQGAIADWLDHDWVRYFLLPGLAALVLAVGAGLADRRQMRRSNPDAIALVPWRGLSFWASFAALLLLGGAFHGWLNG